MSEQTLEEDIAERAQGAVAALQEDPSKKLDFSIESLASIEAALKEASEYADQISDNEFDSLARSIGCYILEVGRRSFGGKYYWHDEKDQPVLVVGEPSSRIAIMTFDRVKSRAKGDTADNIPFFFEGFANDAKILETNKDVLHV